MSRHPIIAIQNCDLFIYVGGENDAWVEDILESMPDNGRKTLKLTDCVDTVEEEQKEGMKEERDHDHEDGQDQDSHDEESHSVHEIDWIRKMQQFIKKMPRSMKKNFRNWTGSSGK